MLWSRQQNTVVLSNFVGFFFWNLLELQEGRSTKKSDFGASTLRRPPWTPPLPGIESFVSTLPQFLPPTMPPAGRASRPYLPDSWQDLLKDAPSPFI